jgi:segregation and condensation protein B
VKADERKQIVEALLLAAREPLAAAQIGKLAPGLGAAGARELLEALRAEYDRDGRGFALCEVAGGWQLRTRPELAEFVQRLELERPARISRAALETLAIVAYRQPVTRAEVEHVRGVDCGPVLRSLLERHLLRLAGHREVPGRPMLYGTTRRFLEVFGLAGLEDLPSLRDVEELARAAAAAAAEAEAASADSRVFAPEGAGGATLAPAGAAATGGGEPDADEDADDGDDPGRPWDLH